MGGPPSQQGLRTRLADTKEKNAISIFRIQLSSVTCCGSPPPVVRQSLFFADGRTAHHPSVLLGFLHAPAPLMDRNDTHGEITALAASCFFFFSLARLLEPQEPRGAALTGSSETRDASRRTPPRIATSH